MHLLLSNRQSTNLMKAGEGYKYGDLSLQIGGVSDETVKYGHELCGTQT
jgi:hypothetical protein